MAYDFPDFKDGDTLEPWHLNMILGELRRIRKLDVTPPLYLDGMDSLKQAPQLSVQMPYAVVASASANINAASGNTPTRAWAILCTDNGTGYAATSPPVPVRVVWSFRDKRVNSGATFVAVPYRGNEYQIVMVSNCSGMT